MRQARAGDWVRIYRKVISAEERSPQIPDDTRATELGMWVKGTIQADGDIGDHVEVVTTIGRRVSGKLIEVNPCYELDFGEFRRDLLDIGTQVRGLLKNEVETDGK
ncbi:2-amino-4-oxopentanoate thiolase subunit OrtA [uncultured Ruegeria sp.]|uniref:2-amino-4-oxopentanoate thiolase subunit OrtA n=1 Tax=uncultured Ruegeria sp. TaxID=259304 RepID=UPI002616B63A|nr:2-amino-4-oxopentanoate thiolase subunit OrtA [uncultured Ruegeria sp.]